MRGSFGPRSDLDRTSIRSRLLMQKSGFEAIPLLAVSATGYHIALPIGFVRLRQASSCLEELSFEALTMGKPCSTYRKIMPDVSATEYYGLM